MIVSDSKKEVWLHQSGGKSWQMLNKKNIASLFHNLFITFPLARQQRDLAKNEIYATCIYVTWPEKYIQHCPYYIELSTSAGALSCSNCES